MSDIELYHILDSLIPRDLEQDRIVKQSTAKIMYDGIIKHNAALEQTRLVASQVKGGFAMDDEPEYIIQEIVIKE